MKDALKHVVKFHNKSVGIVPVYKKKSTHDSGYHEEGDLIVFCHEHLTTFECHNKRPDLIEGGVYVVKSQEGHYITLIDDTVVFSEWFATERKYCSSKYLPHYIYDNRFFYNSSKNDNFKLI